MEVKSLAAIAAFVLVTCGNSALAVDFDPAGQQSLASVTETIDPCQVIPAADVEAELGIPVVGKADLVRALRQGQPTQISSQASCVYRPTSRDAVQLTVRIIPHDNPQHYLKARQDRQERLSRRPGAAEPQDRLVSLPSIGEGAYADIPPGGGPATLEVAVRRWVVTITLSESGKGSTLETLQHLARVAVERLALNTARATDPGLNALAGTWFATTADGRSPELEAVIVIGQDGNFALTVARELIGRLQMTHSRWQVLDLTADQETASGEYTLSASGQLRLTGTVQAELTRVPCNQEPRHLHPFYRLTKYSLLRTELPGVARLRLQRDTQGGKIDPALYGLWEGRATINGQTVELLWRIRADAPPQSVMTVLVTVPGRIQAANGQLTFMREGELPERATYDLLGGRTKGAIAVRDSTREWQWLRYDPAVRNPRIEKPIVGECPAQP